MRIYNLWEKIIFEIFKQQIQQQLAEKNNDSFQLDTKPTQKSFPHIHRD